MCKDDSITTSWSWVSVFVFAIFAAGAIIATSLGIHLTWGEIVIIPFILSFFLNKKCYYCFTDSGFTVQWLFFKRTISADKIKQIDFFGTKSGTWIVIELIGAPSIDPRTSRKAIISYCLRHYRKSFLLGLQWGERDKALILLRRCFPNKSMMTF